MREPRAPTLNPPTEYCLHGNHAKACPYWADLTHKRMLSLRGLKIQNMIIIQSILSVGDEIEKGECAAKETNERKAVIFLFYQTHTQTHTLQFAGLFASLCFVSSG